MFESIQILPPLVWLLQLSGFLAGLVFGSAVFGTVEVISTQRYREEYLEELHSKDEAVRFAAVAGPMFVAFILLVFLWFEFKATGGIWMFATGALLRLSWSLLVWAWQFLNRFPGHASIFGLATVSIVVSTIFVWYWLNAMGVSQPVAWAIETAVLGYFNPFCLHWFLSYLREDNSLQREKEDG